MGQNRSIEERLLVVMLVTIITSSPLQNEA